MLLAGCAPVCSQGGAGLVAPVSAMEFWRARSSAGSDAMEISDVDLEAGLDPEEVCSQPPGPSPSAGGGSATSSPRSPHCRELAGDPSPVGMCASDPEMQLDSVESDDDNADDLHGDTMALGEFSDDSGGPDVEAGGWRPGINCGQWLVGKRGLGTQAQVLIANVYLNLRLLPAKICQAVLSHLGVRVTRNFADRLAGRLCGVSHSTGRWVHDRLSALGWQPTGSRGTGVSEDSGGKSSLMSPLDAMKVRVREVLAVCCRGRPDSDYTRAMQRLELHGLRVGGKYSSEYFVQAVELLAATATRAQKAESLSRPSLSLGIATDISIIWDGVSIGARNFSRNETLSLIGFVHMTWGDKRRGRSHGRIQTCESLIAGPSSGQAHVGTEQVQLLRRALEEHPGHFTTDRLKALLASVGSDGACALGGENHQHSSTGASELFWESIHGKGEAPPPAEWDLFHRIDLAATKAVAQVPAAIEIFDVARALSALFGVGDGRVLLRATADAIGERQRTVPDQGGTRKVVALIHTIDHLCRSYRSFHGALVARRGQMEGGRGAQTKTHLVAVGRRLSDAGFVAFILAAGDVLRLQVQPLALQAQSCRGASWDMHRACCKAPEQLKATRGHLGTVKKWILVGALLHQYVGARDLVRFCWVLTSSRAGRAVPNLTSSLHDLVFRLEYHNCSLTRPAQTNTATNVLSPRCQCASMRSRADPRRVEICLPRGRRVNRMVDWDGPVIKVMVPRWVGASAYPRHAWRAQCDAPRFVEVAREKYTPAALRGAPRYVQTGHGPRCVVPAFLPATVAGVVAAITQAENLCEQLEYYLAGYAAGSIGVNRTLRDTMASAATCWDWAFLVQQPPQTEHYHFLFALAAALRPTLRHTSWPTHPDFQWLPQQWPAVRGPNGLFEQYRLLMQRIRARSIGGAFSDLRRLLVEPVVHFVPLALSLGQVTAFASQLGATKRCLLSTIGMFVGDAAGPGVIAGRPFEVAARNLSAPGYGRASAMSRSLRSCYVFRGAIGSFASLATPRLKGRLVRVVASTGGPDEEAIASALFGDRRIVFPGADGKHCWFAVRVYMRSRLMRAPESGCERWGSLLHDLWDANAGWKPHRMVSRLLMREAGMDGIADDCEAVVNELALVLTGNDGVFNSRGHLVRDGAQHPSPSTGNRAILPFLHPPRTPRLTIHPAPLRPPRPPLPPAPSET